jgi:hypothetical protein
MERTEMQDNERTAMGGAERDEQLTRRRFMRLSALASAGALLALAACGGGGDDDDDDEEEEDD